MSKIYASKSNEIEQREIMNSSLVRKIAGECLVLLENDGTLPIKEAGKVALYGNGVRKTVKGGTGSGEVNARCNVNVEQGFTNAGFEITTHEWLNSQDRKYTEAKKEYLELIEAEAGKKGVQTFVVQFDQPFQEPAPVRVTEKDIKDSNCKTAFYILARNSGEGADRYAREGDYYLYPEEKRNLEMIGEYYENTIVVLNIGGVMDLSEIKSVPGINAVLLMNQLGSNGGDVLLDVITGKVNPSGKTTDTWAKDYNDYPSSEQFSHNGSVHDEFYTDGIYVGYRYFETFGIQPEYCFGYGLSYTDFSININQVTIEENQVCIRAEVKNTGKIYAGKEVVQVYYSAPQGDIDKPYQELVAYKKTSLLELGMSEEFVIAFDVEDMASYSEKDAAWILEKGDYILRIGNSSRNTKAVAALSLKTTVRTVNCKNLFALDQKMKELHSADILRECSEEQPKLKLIIDPNAVQIKNMCYQKKREILVSSPMRKLTMQDVIRKTCTTEELVAQLTVQEMAEMCVGTLRAGGKSIVGNASHTVPGAAGDTSSVLEQSRGVISLIMADGPAGLRLQPHFKSTKEGTILPGGNILGNSLQQFDPTINEDEVDNYYQYCTAIPIGWALAQSWNEDLIEQAGDMVGSEMEQFHVDLWLAPALNIHRNPLCGRNFEYYSEDPTVSGKTAAAITKGVQKHLGKGTTIKHFAVNNQEDNRYFVNAHISERALREIYLKGFEIAVRKSRPLSIMTSYNLMNGIHTANNYDLLQALARDEWGFDGVVMTDWFTSQDISAITGKYTARYPISSSTGCIYAGNDIQMPGCQKNVDDIVDAVENGKEINGYVITKADLQYCTLNLIHVIERIMIDKTNYFAKLLKRDKS